MGRISKWFGSLWSSKCSPESSPAKYKKKENKTSKCPLPSSGDNSGKLNSRSEGPLSSPYAEGIDASRHAIAMAAATAAVAEAALAAAQAAAEVVRLTSGRQSVREDRWLVLAAVRIQSAFRAYLARRALRALKGLVKLQALVRGHIVRKQSTDMLRRMQAMARIQARASAHRSFTSDLPYAKTGFNDSHSPGFTDPRNYGERPNCVKNVGSLQKPKHSRSQTGVTITNESSQIASRWLSHWMEQCSWDQKNTHETSPTDRADKILEIDTWKPRRNSNQSCQNTPTSQYFSAWNTAYKPNPSASPEAASSTGGDHHRAVGPACAAYVSPRMCATNLTSAAADPRGPYTPKRSECSRTLFGDYLGHPSYMANTESSRAKVRSHSAPKKRVMQGEVLGLSGSFGRELWENSDTVSERGSFSVSGPRRGGYQYSGQARRSGTPGREAGGVGFVSVYLRRF